MTKLRTLLAEDHVLIRDGLRRLIESQPDMEVVGEAHNGEEAVAQTLALAPDVLILDLSMPVVDGMECLRRLKQAKSAAKVLVLTLHAGGGYLREVLELGAVGYVVKTAATREFIDAIQTVGGGGRYIDPRMAGKLAPLARAPSEVHPGNEGLTGREAEVLRRIAYGYSNKEIAARLELSVKTIETYKARGMKKLNLRSRVDIVRKATEWGWYAGAVA